MDKFLLNLITEWRRLGLPFEHDTVVVGVSGGADSLSLLISLDELRKKRKLELRIVAAHFNHRLRGESSDADEEFVRSIALDRRLELTIGHQAPEKTGNVEQNARRARYKFLKNTAENAKAGWVLTAHTMNDQAETFLLNLLRGSGIGGLSGMRPVRDLESSGGERTDSDAISAAEDSQPGDPPDLPFTPAMLARPLLRWARRADTENYVRSFGLEYRYDTMNDDMSFKRVRVRKMLLPLMKEFNPKIVETLARTAEIMQQHTDVLEGPRAEKDDKGLLPSAEVLPIRDLRSLEPAKLPELLRSWLKARRGGLRSITSRHIDAIARLVQSKKSGNSVELPGSGRVRRRAGKLLYENIKVDK